MADTLKKLRAKLKAAEAIQKKHKEEGKPLSPGRAKGIQNIKEQIAKLEKGTGDTSSGKARSGQMKHGSKTPPKTTKKPVSGQMKHGANKPSATAEKPTQEQIDYINRLLAEEKPKTPPKRPTILSVKNIKDVRGTKSVPTPPKKPAKKPAAKKKAPGRFSEEAGKAFFKKLGIDAKYDDDDMPKRSSPERAKGGMVAKKKPVVAKKYGGMAVKKKAGGTVKKMCGGMAHRSKKGKK
jgi:hypothetical protein